MWPLWIKTRLSLDVGFPEWTAQFSVWKTTGKDRSEACAIACQNRAIYSLFPSRMTSHSNIAQFNWECIASLRMIRVLRKIPRPPSGPRPTCLELYSTSQFSLLHLLIWRRGHVLVTDFGEVRVRGGRNDLKFRPGPVKNGCMLYSWKLGGGGSWGGTDESGFRAVGLFWR